jgi:N-acetylglucosamine malate deacetylase 1
VIAADRLLEAAAALAAELRMPEVVRLPGSGPVLLVAPHPDDEVIGAGGTLRKHVEVGDEVHVLFVTDGGKGGGGAGRLSSGIAARRRREAEAACAVLGCAGAEFLGASDGAFHADVGLVDAVRQVIDRRRPRLVYAPGFEERHRDHLLTAALVASAWLTGGGDWTVCAYEVWTPLEHSCLVNITAQMDRKRAAMRCHASQLERLDYLDAMEGLARYRAALIPVPTARFAEAFWRCTPEVYTRAFLDHLCARGSTGAVMERVHSI